jgi:hypothetical protein
MKQFKNPEEFLKVSKKGKTLMIFVKVKPHLNKTGFKTAQRFFNATRNPRNCFYMDNTRRGLHSHAGAGVKTGLGVCITKLRHQI